MVDVLHRRRPLFLLVAPVLMLIFGRPAYQEYIIGVVLVVIGQAIRIWSAGHISKFQELTTSGPFAYVRNPLYLGSFAMFMGYSLMTQVIWVWAPILIVFIVTHWGAVLWEEHYLSARFGEMFEHYRKRVPRLIPRLKPAFPVGGFSLTRAWINREQVSALGTIGVVAIFALKLLWSG